MRINTRNLFLSGLILLGVAMMNRSLQARDPRIAEAAKMEPKIVLNLWPETPPGERGEIGEEKADPNTEDPPITLLRNVSVPTLSLYPANRDGAEQENAAAKPRPCIIIFPGGAYHILAMDLEGTEIAHWIRSLGIDAILCKYRVPRREDLPKHLAPLQDAQRTIRLVRKNAEKWNIDPEKIGVLGFSAGGHLCIMSATAYEEKIYEPCDEVDRLSARPNFALPIYPAYILGEDGKTWNKSGTPFSEEVKIGKHTPPFFISIADDDPVGSMGAARVYIAMRDLDIPCELHVFVKGGHGYGLRKGVNRAANWADLAEGWLKTMVLE